MNKEYVERREGGYYVAGTRVSLDSLIHEASSEEAVRYYKSLSKVEHAFRSLKSVDLKVRPIHHRSSESSGRRRLTPSHLRQSQRDQNQKQ